MVGTEATISETMIALQLTRIAIETVHNIIHGTKNIIDFFQNGL